MSSLDMKALLANAEEVDTTPVPTGKYVSEVVEAEWTKTKTDKDMLKVVFKIAVGPEKGRKLYNNMTISPESPKSLGFFFAHLEILGCPKTVVGDLSKQEIADRITGGRALLTVSHREYQGKTQAEVKYLDPVPADMRPDDAPPTGDTPPPAAPSGDTPPPPPFSS